MLARLQKNNAGSPKAIGRRLRLPWRSLPWQLIFITILPLTVLVLVISFGSLAVHQNAMRTLVGERDKRAVLTAATALEDQVNHQTIAIRMLSLLAEGASPEMLPTILASADYLLPEFDVGLAFFNQEGELETSMGGQTLWENQSGRISRVIRESLLKSASQTYLSSDFTVPLSGEPAVLLLAVSPMKDWIAVGALSAAGMIRHTLTNAFSNSPQISIVVMDANKQLLFESGAFSYVGEISNHPGISEALQGESGTTYVQVGGSEHVVAYSPVAPMGWALVLEEPWELVATPTLRASQIAPLVVVPVLILALVAFWFGARQIVKPLQNLESKAATLARGDFKAIETPVGGIEEIRQLQAELIHMARKVQEAQQSLHGYIGAITAAQEEERRRLARELHDDTIQALIALKQRMQLAQLSLVPEMDSVPSSSITASGSAALQEIASLTEQTIENLRRLTRALRPIYLEDLGLVTALEMLVRETGQAMNIKVDFQLQGMEKRLDAVNELALYRMVQEAFSNISRHAQASHAYLKITFTTQVVTIQISDNGKGFEVPKSPAEFAPSGHFGLLGLHERAELIGASLEIRSRPGEGTHLTISLPLSPS